jgi:ATP-dependent DNA helicase DinG
MGKKHGAVVDAGTRFSSETQDKLRDAILGMEGREVFAIGALDASGMVQNLEIVARGTEGAVAAPFRYRTHAQVLIHNHPSGTLFPSDADLAVAAEAGAEGIGSYIVDNEVSQVLVVAEPARFKTIRPLNAEEIAAVLDTDGKLSRVMPNSRRARRRSNGPRCHASHLRWRHLRRRGGTGVGKSFAYPFRHWHGPSATANVSSFLPRRSIFSSKFSKKVLPIVSSLFKKPAKAAVVKGRGNYLCRRRLYEAIEETLIFRFIHQIEADSGMGQ